jgi:hypothetical protein
MPALEWWQYALQAVVMIAQIIMMHVAYLDCIRPRVIRQGVGYAVNRRMMEMVKKQYG